jgi:outer membrane protein assembly factor BamD
MRFRPITLSILAMVLALGSFGTASAQSGSRAQSELSASQRLDVMRSKLEALRRSLNSAIAGIPQPAANDKNKKAPNADDPRVRLQGLEKEVGSILSEVNDLHSKVDRSERFDATKIDSLETSVTEIDTRVQSALQATASARTGVSTAAASTSAPKDKKKGFRLWPFGGGGNDKYKEELTTVAPGRDRVLFEDAAKEVRKGDHETGRLLFTTIITTYPDSPFLPLAKLAIADSFYLEGGTSQLIQAAAAYQDWLTFFPTDPLADAALLKVAESEMRQMGLPDRSIEHARKAEQRLKALLQQYPRTRLRATVEDHLREVQENLAMHDYGIGEFYLEPRYKRGKGGLKGAQSRFKEIIEKYPCFSLTDKVLLNLGYTYQQEEEPDEAAKYYQQLVQNYPDSEYAEKAKEQLNIIGVPIPEKTTPSKCPKREKPSFMGNLMQQVAGRADVTVGNDGILISRNRKDNEGKDLIDIALEHNGQLPSNTTPQAPSTAQPRPVNNNDDQADKNKVGAKSPTPSPTPPPLGAKP